MHSTRADPNAAPYIISLALSAIWLSIVGNVFFCSICRMEDKLRLAINSMTFVHWHTRTMMLLSLLWFLILAIFVF